ncbi:Z1 domain-containing protein [Desulfoluna sp.]|uniref:Z1 domain-containing protein n=1 Tax=Desulfoluna sp. TaxID=2045199 RepID=UPI00263608DE|nr:Z1 domain-containing protein [Desulfoluna sp.]
MLKADFEVIALLTCKNLPGELDRALIDVTVRRLASPHNFEDHIIEEVIKQVETRLVTTMAEGVSLVDIQDDHDEDWVNDKEGLSWSYWNEYKEQLLIEGWGDKVLHSLGEVTDRILGLLNDPHTPGEWDRRGLVVGHVQSGKTANYIGLISKAADAGYRFIIVIAGIHNNLRKQTQKRVDEGFVGLTGDGEKINRTGVGKRNKARKGPVPLTNTTSDFNKKVAASHSADLELYESAGRPAILVIKKNVTTLKRVYEWLRDLNTEQDTQISKIPMLLIDDEADNASINTNKPDLDPTKTNAWIRQLLNLFKKSCYVGYTATPFANIFINPKDENEMLGDELFPRDFIYCLDAPSNYFGADKVFIEDDISSGVLRTISDAEDYIPLSHKRFDEIPDLPPSAVRALQTFVLAKAIRVLRGHESKHCSMMLNVSRFVDTQRQIREHVSHYLSEVHDAILSNYKKPVSEALRSSMIAQLKNVFDAEYADCPETWEQVQNSLYCASEGMKTYLVNSKSDESLDYGKYEDAGDALTAVAIGGLSLSRGLTLEGLTVSYMYRNTKMYDTLMQMGRWFGYRPGYDDLCRIYLSEDSQGWYAHIAEASEDLRQQIKQMRRDGFSPRDFGLYVRSHPDALLVTALNKMRHAQKMIFKVSFDGVQRETYVLPASETIRRDNLAEMSSLFLRLNNDFNGQRIDERGGVVWRRVPLELVLEFMEKFRFHRELQGYKDALLSYTREVSDRHPCWDIAFISLVGSSPAHDILPMAAQRRQVGRIDSQIKKPSEEEGWYVGNKQKVAGTGVESIGLNEGELARAQEIARENGRPNKPTDRDYRHKTVRGRPLLMLHLLELFNKIEGDIDVKAALMPAVGFSFPAFGDTRSVECVVNKVWLERDMVDSPDEEDDYDID